VAVLEVYGRGFYSLSWLLISSFITDPTSEAAALAEGSAGSRSRRRVTAERGGSSEFEFS
jgi:hypothetical protein